MGIFASGLQAEIALNNLKKGQPASLSYGQVSNLIINLQDARKNLSSDQYEKIYALWTDLQKNKTKLTLYSMDDYYTMAINIITQFDSIAPYEKYSGNSEIETSFLMSEIRLKRSVNDGIHIIPVTQPQPNEALIQYCRRCGNKLRSKDVFCGKCGTKIIANTDSVNGIINKNTDIFKDSRSNFKSELHNNYDNKFELLYSIEHKVLPKMFYDNPMQIAAGIASDSKKLYQFFARLLKTDFQPNSINTSEYKVTVIPFYNGIVEQVMELPSPERAPLCKSIVIFLDVNDKNKLAYYTVEKAITGYVLCAWNKAGAHLNYGFCSPEIAHRLALTNYCQTLDLNESMMINKLPQEFAKLW